MRVTLVPIIILAACAPILVAGCTAGSSPESVPGSTVSTTPPAAPVLPNALPSGQAQIIVNGRDTGPAGRVVCSTDDGLTTVSIGENALGVTVVVTDDDMPSVRSVTIGDAGGISLAYAAGVSGQQLPLAYRNGATLTVTGSGSGTDSTNPARVVDTRYQIVVACP